MFACDLSPTLQLRQLQTENAPALFALTDRNREHLRRWLPWLDKTQQENDSVAFIESRIQAFDQSGALTCGIWHEGVLCGVIGHNEIDSANRIGTLGYWLARDHEGRGLMTRCCRALIQHSFAHQNLNRIVIKVAVGNHRSQAIPNRLGFTREGVLRQAEWLYDRYLDLTVNALLKSDPAPGRD